jgi:hypothetical protein
MCMSRTQLEDWADRLQDIGEHLMYHTEAEDTHIGDVITLGADCILLSKWFREMGGYAVRA